MPYSEAQKRATLKHRSKAYDRMEINAPKGKKAEYAAHAAKRGKSLQALFVELIEADIKRIE